MTEYCVCGHSKLNHQTLSVTQGEVCHDCVMLYYAPFRMGLTYLKPWMFIHPFKLDNLKYIEQLANERRLV